MSSASPGHGSARQKGLLRASWHRPPGVGGCRGWPGQATLGPIHQPRCRMSIPGHAVSLVSCRERATRGQHRLLPPPLPPPAPRFWQGQAGAGLWALIFTWRLPEILVPLCPSGNREPGVRVSITVSVQGPVQGGSVWCPCPSVPHTADTSHPLMEMSPWLCPSCAGAGAV